MSFLTIIFIITALAALANLFAELRRDLTMLQQNSYRRERYINWIKQSGDTTSTPRLLGMAVFLMSQVIWASADWAVWVMLLFASCNFIVLLRKKYKKPLVMTPRARRILTVDCLICLLIIGAAALGFGLTQPEDIFYGVSLGAIALYVLSHVVTICSLIILGPLEKHINQGFINDAARILKSMPQLKVIGITGSYGKTSTKHFLNTILSQKFDVLMTPGSYNTTLGVVRTVREMLKPFHQVFIVEMGAKNVGDIKEICDLVHPSSAILTAVGEQHLESFKTIENVQRTKFELVDSLPVDGIAVVNNDFPYVANRPVDNVKVLRYAVSNTEGADFIATDIVYTPGGSSFRVKGVDGTDFTLTTRLVGECNISNLLGAVVMALQEGMSYKEIQYGVEQIEAVEHRLSLKRTPGGITILDDAFNSNPAGSKMALDVLASMTGGRRIIITPGMIELGSRQEELNREFGRHIARSADIAVIVGNYNREAICSGIEEVLAEKSDVPKCELIKVRSFAESQQVLAPMLRKGDVVLYENDLPDTFK
ncbi:MAG: UDP-N-acetylmuramoyl-tripeptide--D-alanyl-D-alanine ligase [Paramuribaculum sp.]|nr:UDP-N-acetylmuramoyl-tripeptide--D-alanyl-D-alanine ligase [Paramuribaculum sp.]